MTKIQLRHDTSTKWQTANPILASGEVAVETDTQKIKVGNGTTPYNNLEYIGNGSTSDAYTKAETDELLDTKQDIITDLSTIRNGASLGATALQPGANISDLTNDSNYLVNNFSNLSSEGLDKLNQSKALKTGSVSSDADVYADIQKYAHSTFDLSKFEVVGSPVITDDGIASGFSSSNCIKKDLGKSYSAYNITFEFTTNDTIINQGIIQFNENPLYVIDISGTGNLYYRINKGYELIASSSEISANTKYLINISCDGVTTKINLNGRLKLSSNNIFSLQSFKLGATETSSPFFDGSIDLKFIAIWADGMPVFNGNKTGLYIAKSDNYEVVGSPTISEDGIASGFSNSNYLTKTLNTNFLNSNFDLIIPVGVTNAGSDSGNAITLMNGTALVARAYLASDGYLFSLYYKDRTIVIYGANLIPKANLTSNAINYIRITRVDNKINYYGYYNNKWNLRTSSTIPDGQSFDENIDIYIGAQRKGENALSTYVDLNLIKFYSNGNLIYQPCLKIPYTESKTGSKIVDVAYRDRVQDLYEQTGEALFYTLDEENQDFTLPAGDIYGMITKTNKEVPTNIVTTSDSTSLVIWRGTQSAYDGIATKDENTLYIITGA